MTTVTIPLRVVGALNAREHWRRRHSRVKAERHAVGLVLNTLRLPPLPVDITLTRIAPRPLDSHDNLTSAFKGCVDQIAATYDVDDRSAALSIRYAQERGKPREYAVRIQIEPRAG